MTERHEALRRLLVTTADGASPSRPRVHRWMPLLGLGVFAAAGALTGGAVAYGATASADRTGEIAAQAVGASLIGSYAPIVGDTTVATRSGTSTVDFGDRPPEATSLAFAIHCNTPATLTMSVNGTPDGWLTCDSDAAGIGWGGMSTFFSSTDDVIVVSVEADDSASYSLWGAWVAVSVLPAPSAASTASLADGVVDSGEYRAAFERYRDCLAAAGHQIVRFDDSQPVFAYSIPAEAVTDGSDGECYAREFSDIDEQWQLAQESP